MYRYTTKAEIPLNIEQTLKQWRIRMKTGPAKGRSLMGEGG
jgi:hypothetical protein